MQSTPLYDNPSVDDIKEERFTGPLPPPDLQLPSDTSRHTTQLPPPSANQQPIIHSSLERSQIRASSTLILHPDSLEVSSSLLCSPSTPARLTPCSSATPLSTSALISMAQADPQLDTNFAFASSHSHNPASSHDQNYNSDSRQCDSGPNTSPLPLSVPLYFAARHHQEEQFKEDQHLFVSSFALIEDPPSPADDDTESSSGDYPFGDTDRAISLKRQIFVKQCLLPHNPPKNKNNAPLVDSIDEILPKEVIDLEEIEELHGLIVISNDEIQEENLVKMLEEEKVAAALSDSPSGELDLESLGKSRSQILEPKFNLTLAELLDESRVMSLSVYGNLEAVSFVQKKLKTMASSVDSLEVSRFVMDAHMKLGNIEEVLILFQATPETNITSWTSIVAGFARNCYGEEALQYFSNIQKSMHLPNSSTLSAVLYAYAILTALRKGLMVHGCAIHHGIEPFVYVFNTLVNIYAKCGDIKSASKVFDEMKAKELGVVFVYVGTRPPDQLCLVGFVLGKASEVGFENYLCRILVAPALKWVAFIDFLFASRDKYAVASTLEVCKIVESQRN